MDRGARPGCGFPLNIVTICRSSLRGLESWGPISHNIATSISSILYRDEIGCEPTVILVRGRSLDVIDLKHVKLVPLCYQF
jgi:hypothetical protein